MTKKALYQRAQKQMWKLREVLCQACKDHPHDAEMANLSKRVEEFALELWNRKNALELEEARKRDKNAEVMWTINVPQPPNTAFIQYSRTPHRRFTTWFWKGLGKENVIYSATSTMEEACDEDVWSEYKRTMHRALNPI